jgi:hypothetical protein
VYSDSPGGLVAGGRRLQAKKKKDRGNPTRYYPPCVCSEVVRCRKARTVDLLLVVKVDILDS